MTSRKLYTREITVWVFAFTIVFSGFTCEKGSQIIKVATYNIYFLDDGISVERKANLRKVIELLDADIIGFQEIKDPAALKNILPPNYQVAMIDDSSEVQELAIAVRSPLKVRSVRYVFPDTDVDNAFPRKRDLLQGTIEAYIRSSNQGSIDTKPCSVSVPSLCGVTAGPQLLPPSIDCTILTLYA